MRLIALFAAVVLFPQIGEGGAAHLLPVRPAFDAFEPGSRFAKPHATACEKLLFTPPDWVIRYYSSGESTTLGLSISRAPDGKFMVTVRQATPALGSVIREASSLGRDLDKALAAVRIDKAQGEIPEATSMAIRSLWLSLLNRTEPVSDERLKQYYQHPVLSETNILFAKASNGRILAGKLPPDAYKYSQLMSVQDIVGELVRICIHPGEKHQGAFKRLERKALALASGAYK